MAWSDVSEQRRKTMQGIRSKNTAPELRVRSLLHKAGYRFRLHRRDLPGSPDIVFPSRRATIFVHGCFWHQHNSCRGGHVPASRQEYWQPKLIRNVERDAAALQSLRQLGWKALVVWECELANREDRVMKKITKFLGA